MNSVELKPAGCQLAARKLSRTWAVGLALVATGLCSSCQTLEQMAPSVGPEFLEFVTPSGTEMTTLEMGRVVYLTDCVRCHGVEPVLRYTEKQWREIIPRMALETRLDAQRTAAVEAYVLTAREVLERSAIATEGR